MKKIEANEFGAGLVGEFGSVCTIVETKTFDHEAQEALNPTSLTRRALMPRWSKIVRHRVSAAHKRMYGLTSCDPVAGNWNTVY